MAEAASLADLTPVVAVVFLFLIFLWKAGNKFVESLDKLTDAQNRSVDATKELVAETRKGNEEAAERNGHLGEQNVQITDMIRTHTETMTDELSKVHDTLDSQTVRRQVVEHQTVKE